MDALLHNRAFSLFEVKEIGKDKRTFTGVATSISPDRMNDIVEPKGIKFKNPLPLLFQHRHSMPIGKVWFDKPTSKNITFRAEIADPRDSEELKKRCDEAWESIRLGLTPAVSIGFRPLEYSYLENGGVHFVEIECYELSVVTIPAQADAVIDQIKSMSREGIDALRKFDVGAPAAEQKTDANHRPGAAGIKSFSPVSLRPKEANMTYAEQIAALEAKRAANSARMDAIMKSGTDEGRTTTKEEGEEFDSLNGENDQIVSDLKRLRVMEKNVSTAAAAVTAGDTVTGGTAARVPAQVRQIVKREPGIGMARVVRMIGKAGGSLPQAFELSKADYAQDEAIAGILKAAVAAGTTSHATWAGPLVGDETGVFADFLEYLRPQTILGRFGTNGIPALRNVPFRVPLIAQTSGGDGYWVGEGKPKPLTKFDFSRITLEPLKVANIAVLTKELLRDSSPSAETLIRDSLVDALRARLDIDFINPAKTASAGVSPASITQGVSPVPSSGNDAEAIKADVKALMGAFIAANNPPTTGVWIMPATVALSLSLMTNELGQTEFPGISMTGGTFMGIPVIVSQYMPTVTAGSYVALVNASDIYFADNGGFEVQMSDQASLQMDNAPTSHDAGTGDGVELVSLWQTNSVGFLAERSLNWARRRTSAVQLLSQVNWGAPSGS